MSEEFPHEVLPTQQKRESIAGWFLTEKVLIRSGYYHLLLRWLIDILPDSASINTILFSLKFKINFIQFILF
ncbi:hypothetical protein AB6G21_08465 [Providencia hangzhouensis]|uniref:hypothetical protein n=1 Tax=Providencia hangzhouensis TaxID=3031799 RepID=UPI0034DD44F0